MKRFIYIFLLILILTLFWMVKSVLDYKKYGEFKNANLNKLSRLLIKGNFEQAEKLVNIEKFSLDEENNKGKTLLYLFVKNRKTEAFEWLLTKKANPNLLLKNNEDSVMRQVSECNDSSYLKIALKYGGDPLLVHSGGNRPLYFACILDRQENIDILIKAGDNGNIADQFRNTTFKCLIISNQYDKVNLLLDKGLNPFQSNQEDRESIVYYVEVSHPSLSDKLKPHYLKVVDKLRSLGFKIELLNSDEYIQRDEDRRKAGREITPGNP